MPLTYDLGDELKTLVLHVSDFVVARSRDVLAAFKRAWTGSRQVKQRPTSAKSKYIFMVIKVLVASLDLLAQKKSCGLTLLLNRTKIVFHQPSVAIDSYRGIIPPCVVARLMKPSKNSKSKYVIYFFPFRRSYQSALGTLDKTIFKTVILHVFRRHSA